MAAPLLAACGGGGDGAGAGGGGGAQTFAASTPSLDNDARAFAAGRTYSSTSRFVQVSGRNAAAFDETVEMRTDANGNLVLSINASDLTLIQDAAAGRYVFDDGSGFAAIAEAALSDHVGTLLPVTDAQTGLDPTFIGGFLLIGDPSTDVGSETGPAIYLRPSAHLAVTDGGDVNGDSCGFLIAADFENADVEGRIALNDGPTGTDFTIDFIGAPISGAGFSTANLQQTGLNGTVAASQLDADFYAPGRPRSAGSIGWTSPAAPGAASSWAF